MAGMIAPLSIALFITSGALFTVFALQRISTVPIIRTIRVFLIHMVRRKKAVLLFIVGSLGGALIYTAIYDIPVFIVVSSLRHTNDPPPW